MRQSDITDRRLYFDYNASAPLLPLVKQTMQESFEYYGNGSSVHREGRKVRALIERAREHVANLAGVRPQDVIFTSGGTEANNLALSPAVIAASLKASLPKDNPARTSSPHLYVSAIEHPAVLQGMRFNPENVTIIPVLPDGIVDMEWLQKTLTKNHVPSPDEESDEKAGKKKKGKRKKNLHRNQSEIKARTAPFLVSVMAANNETGILQPIREIADIVHKAGGFFHSDCVQAAGKIDIGLPELDADMISLSAHKIGGPQGVGALVVRGSEIVIGKPLIAGGGQEMKRRSGTENFSGITGFGAASAYISENEGLWQATSMLRDKFEAGLREINSDVVIFGDNQPRLPNTSMFALCGPISGPNAETLVIQYDLMGISLSAGAACSSGKVETSPVLKAMGVDDELSQRAVRVSLGPGSTEQEIVECLNITQEILTNYKCPEAA